MSAVLKFMQVQRRAIVQNPQGRLTEEMRSDRCQYLADSREVHFSLRLKRLGAFLQKLSCFKEESSGCHRSLFIRVRFRRSAISEKEHIMLLSFFRFMRLFAIAVGAVAALFVGLFALFAYADYREAQFDKRFSFLKDELPRFKELSYPSVALKDLAGIEKSNAKLAILCAQDNDNSVWPLRRYSGSIDPMMASLPEKWVPSNATEVTTLVVLKWSQVQAGTYADGSIGYREQCEVDIVDLATKTRLASDKFLGGYPPTTKRKSNSNEKLFGSGCESAVLKFVEKVMGKS